MLAYIVLPEIIHSGEREDMDNQQQITLPADSTPPTMTEGSILFIGNATVLIRYAGFTILTDPTFIHMHEQTWLGYGMHTTRLTDPAMDIADLPPLDLVVLSHFHGDHFDQVAERDLNKSLPIVTTTAAADDLRQRGFTTIYPLATWSAITVSKNGVDLRITSMPGKHGPPVVDFALPDVMGSMLEFAATEQAAAFRLYITGDTLVIDDLREIPARFPHINLALLHLGGTRVMGVMLTMDAKQGVEAIRIVNPHRAIPIHYNDYDVFTSSLEDFQAEVRAAGLEDRVHYLLHGETYTFTVPEGTA